VNYQIEVVEREPPHSTSGENHLLELVEGEPLDTQLIIIAVLL